LKQKAIAFHLPNQNLIKVKKIKDSVIRLCREVLAILLLVVFYFNKRRNDSVLPIYFHKPSKKLFERIYLWLIRKGYKVISVEEFEAILNSKQKYEKLVIISFDDGWNKNLELIETIEKYNIPVTIFVPTEPVLHGNYWWEYAMMPGQSQITSLPNVEAFKVLPSDSFVGKIELLKSKYNLSRSCITLDELKSLSRHRLITIGSHTVTHPILNQCTVEEQERELSYSRQTLRQWLDKEVEYLSYPNGDFNQTTVQIARHCGYKLCFTTQDSEINVDQVNPYLLPRIAMNDEGGFYENLAKIQGRWRFR